MRRNRLVRVEGIRIVHQCWGRNRATPRTPPDRPLARPISKLQILLILSLRGEII